MKMKKYFLYVAACMLSLGGMMSACSDGDDPSNGNGNGAVEEINITKDNASNWYSYMIIAGSALLRPVPRWWHSAGFL